MAVIVEVTMLMFWHKLFPSRLSTSRPIIQLVLFGDAHFQNYLKFRKFTLEITTELSLSFRNLV